MEHEVGFNCHPCPRSTHCRDESYMALVNKIMATALGPGGSILGVGHHHHSTEDEQSVVAEEADEITCRSTRVSSERRCLFRMLWLVWRNR